MFEAQTQRKWTLPFSVLALGEIRDEAVFKHKETFVPNGFWIARKIPVGTHFVTVHASITGYLPKRHFRIWTPVTFFSKIDVSAAKATPCLRKFAAAFERQHKHKIGHAGALDFFGFPARDVQSRLRQMLVPPCDSTSSRHITKASIGDVRRALDESRSSSSTSLALSPRHFGQESQQKAVRRVIETIESFLLKDDLPNQRCQLILTKFLEHRHVKRILYQSAAAQWSGSEKQFAAARAIIDNLRQAIHLHKLDRTGAGLRLYQSLLNIAAPPPGARLVRATAELLGMSSRIGLIAAQSRKLAFATAMEALLVMSDPEPTLSEDSPLEDLGAVGGLAHWEAKRVCIKDSDQGTSPRPGFSKQTQTGSFG